MYFLILYISVVIDQIIIMILFCYLKELILEGGDKI